MSWRRLALHLHVGLLASLFLAVWPFLGLAFLMAFFAYEISEDWHLTDGAYQDILGAVVGIGAGGIALTVLRILGLF